MQTPQKIAVVGSGLVGTLLAIYLKKLGHTVHVFDRSADIRTVEFSGRSINLVMSNRGWKALDDIGLTEEIKKSEFLFTNERFICKIQNLRIKTTEKKEKPFIHFPEVF